MSWLVVCALWRISDSLLAARAGSCSIDREAQQRLLSPTYVNSQFLQSTLYTIPVMRSSDGRSLGFLKIEASVRTGLKTVFTPNCCRARLTWSETPFAYGTTARPVRSGSPLCGLDLGAAALNELSWVPVDL